MKANPAYFIEQIKSNDGRTGYASPSPIRLLEWSLEANERLNIETIAVFKIYPKTKPVIAHYDYDLKTTIVE